jgi:hypothetical protein
MPLPSLGNQISIGDIRTEIQNTGKTVNFSLRLAGGYENDTYVPINQSSTNKPNLTDPYQISEWASYNHTQSVTCSNNFIISPTLSSGRVYHKLTITGTAGQIAKITINHRSNDSVYTSIVELYLQYPFDDDGTISVTPYRIFVGTLNNDYTNIFYYTLSSTSDNLHFVVRRFAI